VLERVRLRQANRIVNAMGHVSKADLLRIEAEDILKSRVFTDEEEVPPDEAGEAAISEDGQGSDDGQDTEEREESKASQSEG
jgi:hypothetical protein